ncbi:MAG: RHS repeat-associated core domain-containing protein [Pseudomonadota bacterium]
MLSDANNSQVRFVFRQGGSKLTSVAESDYSFYRYTYQSGDVSEFDTYGNYISTTEEITKFTNSVPTGEQFPEHSSVTTTYIYAPGDTRALREGRPSSVTVTRDNGDGSPVETRTRKTAFTYDSAGRAWEETLEPDSATHWLKKTTTYDTYGNVQRVVTTGPNFAYDANGASSLATPAQLSRESATYYGVDGYFPEVLVNAKNHSEVHIYDPRFGVAVSTTGPNGLTTTWDYDEFGSQIAEYRADGTSSTVSRNFCSTCRTGEAYFSMAQSSGAAPAYTYFDKMGREIRNQTKAFDAIGGDLWTTQTKTYDELGRVKAQTDKYFELSPGVAGAYGATCYTYDTIGRVKTSYQCGNQTGLKATTELSYLGNNTTVTKVTDPTNKDGIKIRIKEERKNGNGNIMSVREGNELGYTSTITYTYDAYYQLKTVTDINSNVTSFNYDVRGRKISMKDPDKGQWQYRYNAFGELVWQKDAEGQLVEMAYDELGRVVQRKEKGEDATRATPETTTWVYDSAVYGIGKLASVSNDITGYKRSLVYDVYGRPTQETGRILTTDYAVERTYDAYGRVETTKYPQTPKGRLATRNEYNADGYLVRVCEAKSACNTSDNIPYWELKGVTARGQVSLEKSRNGMTTVRTYDPEKGSVTAINTGRSGITVQNLAYVYDSIGNVEQRDDLITERALTVSETFKYDEFNRLTDVMRGASTTSYRYDAIGNIKSKSDFGDNYVYGENGAGPHAVTTVNMGANKVAGYTYNKNGDMLTGGGRTLAYTSFGKPRSINNSVETAVFSYDDAHERTVQMATSGNTVYISPRWDTGNHFEVETDNATGVNSYKHYIYGGGQMVAIYTVKSDTTPAETVYLHKDHLGSVTVVTNETVSTDIAVLISARYSYDAFGARRQIDGQAATSTIIAGVTHHGYTGHEHLDELGLVHMNGRVYDPQLGRMLQADSVLPSLTYTQALNRYSYMFNNPMGGTDPDGHEPITATVIIAAFIFNAIVAGVQSNWDPGAMMLGGIMGAMAVACPPMALAAGGVMAYQNYRRTGDRRQLIAFGASAIVGYATGQLGQGWSPGARMIVSAVAGGAVAQLSGGRFENGAATGLASYLFGEAVNSAQGGGGTSAADNVNPEGCRWGDCVVGQPSELNFGDGSFENVGRPKLGGEPAQVGVLRTLLERIFGKGPSVAKGLPEGAQYAQKTFNPMFSKGGAFAGQSVDDER